MELNNKINSQNEEIKEKERQEMEIRKYNQMSYRQVLDDQVKYKVNYPIQISMDPHLENRYNSFHVNNSNL